MVTPQNVIRAFVLALTVVLMQGCSSLELAVDLYKKQKRETTGKDWARYGLRSVKKEGTGGIT